MSMDAGWHQQKVSAHYMEIMLKEHNHLFHISSDQDWLQLRLNTEQERKPSLPGLSGGSCIHCDQKTPICKK
ncbi:hypothetical protein BT93_J0419 [Corymbia citriodora subsp. variegata]|nr:hypothetical protein BT93_J0419 [Corymbia citriodora subsp. variegata]